MDDWHTMHTVNEERNELANRVYRVIAGIPVGQVTTYGEIARAVGLVRGARRVGWILFNVSGGEDLPCHRVVNHAGFLSGGWHFGHPDIMQAMLMEENVPFAAEHRVDIKRCLWIPDTEDSPTADEMDDLDSIAGM